MTPAPRAAPAPRFPSWVWLAAPMIVAAWLRWRGLGDPEPFVDEGANILTALDPRVREAFEPLAQGRPWLSWLYRPAGWFPSDVLLAARFMTTLAGLATMAALGWTLKQLGGRAAALIGMWLWAVLPFAVWHERLALQDPFVTALLAGSTALLAAGAASKRPWLWLAAGILGGMAFLLKISALFAVAWLAILYIALQRAASRPVFDRRLVFIVIGALLPVATLGTNLFKLGGNLDRYDALPTAAGGGFAGQALTRLGEWLGLYGGYGRWPLALLIVGAVVLAAKSRHRLALGCAAAWAIATLVTALFYHNVYARYGLPDHLPLVLFLALAVSQIRPLSAALLLAVPLTGWAFTAWQIGSAPEKASVPSREIVQYYTGPWSGRGLKEIRQHLTGHADANQVQCVVLTHRFLRPGCYGLLLAELGDPRINVVPVTIYDPADLETVRPGLRHLAEGRRLAFFLLYEGSLYPAHPWLDATGSPARRVHTETRGPGEEFALYQLTP